MSKAEATITDADGKKLRIVGLSIVEQYRLAKAMGGDAVGNGTTLSMASCAAAIREVDGVPLPYPVSQDGIELNLERIGEAGYVAYFGWLNTRTAAAVEDAKAAMAAGEAAGPLVPSAGSPSTPA